MYKRVSARIAYHFSVFLASKQTTETSIYLLIHLSIYFFFSSFFPLCFTVNAVDVFRADVTGSSFRCRADYDNNPCLSLLPSSIQLLYSITPESTRQQTSVSNYSNFAPYLKPGLFKPRFLQKSSNVIQFNFSISANGRWLITKHSGNWCLAALALFLCTRPLSPPSPHHLYLFQFRLFTASIVIAQVQ